MAAKDTLILVLGSLCIILILLYVSEAKKVTHYRKKANKEIPFAVRMKLLEYQALYNDAVEGEIKARKELENLKKEKETLQKPKEEELMEPIPWLGSTQEKTNVMNSKETPAHYKHARVTPNEYISDLFEGRADLTPNTAYLLGQVIKYASRLGLKDDHLKDAVKLNHYAQAIVDDLTKTAPQ